MLRKMLGKILPHRSSVELQEIEQDGKQRKPERSIKGMEKNLITSGSTGRVLWIMFLLVLSAAMLTGSDNQNDPK